MENCVNKSLPEFKKLQEETLYNNSILQGKISVWQDNNTLDRFPTLEEINVEIIPISKVNEVLGTSYRKDLNPDRLIDIKKKISKVNNDNFKKSINEVYSLNTKKLGESDLVNWKLIKSKGKLDIDAKIERAISRTPDPSQDKTKIDELKKLKDSTKPGEQGTLFQTESKGTVNEALNNIIKIFLSKSNFNVEEVFDEIKTQTGENATASVDLFNRLIKISKNKQGEDTLTEEAAHVLEAMLGKNHPLYQKMFNLIEQTEVWESTLSEYNTVYDGNLDKIKFEAIGKMITKVAIQKFKKNELNTTSNNVWDKFSKLVQAAFKWLSNKFKNVPDTFESEIEKVYGEAANMLLTGNIKTNKNNLSNTFYQLINKIKPGVQELFESTPELADAVYEALGFKEKSLTNLEKVSNLIKQIQDFDYSYEGSGNDYLPNRFNKIARELENFIKDNRSDTSLPKLTDEYFVLIEQLRNLKQEINFESEEYQQYEEYLDQNKFLDKLSPLYKKIANKEKEIQDKFGNELSKITPREFKGGNVFISFQQNQQAQQLYSQYLDTAKPNVILPTDRIVFGHPTIGKSFLKNQGEDKFISLDDDYATEINNKVKEIANKYNVTTYQVKDGGTQKWNNEYNQMMQEMFNVAKQRAISENKTLFTSNTNLLRNNAESFDKVINLTDKEFERRIQERGAKYDTKEWKSQINEAISKLPTNKVINTDKYLSDLFLGSKQDIEGFKEFVNNQTFFQLDSDKKKKSDYKDAIQEQIERSEIKIQRIKKQTPNWKNNPKASVAISKLEEYIKNLKEDRALILIENKANNELNAIEAKLEDLDSIADKEGFFTYALDTLKGWQDLDEFITYPEDKEGKNRIIAMTGRANNLEKVLMNKFQDFASEKYGEDFNSSIIDESFFGANFLDIAQSKIPILKKIGEFINKARFTAYELTKQLETKTNEEFELLKKWSGYKSDKELWDLFRQKDSKGNWTGNYVAEISNSFYEKKKELATWAKENKSFSAYYRWLNANTDKVFDKEAFNAMYKQVKTNEFTQTDGTIDEAGLQAWVKANNENSNKSPFITYTPKVELWKDKKYEYIQSVPELKRFYDFFINTLEERMSVLPSYEKKQSNYLPELKRNTFLDFSKGGMTGLLKEWTNQFKDSFANDIESSKETVLRDPITGEPEKTIPVYMMSDRLNPEDKEYDLTKVLKSFGAMSYMYEQKNAIEEPVKLMASLFRNLKEKLVAEGTDKTDRFGKLVEILDGNKQAVSMMDYHIDAMLYDKTREDDTTKKLGEITVDGETKKVTAGSIIDWLINYTRIKGLAGNIFSGVTNSTFGISANFIHAEGKVDFNPTQAMDALGIMLNAVIKGSDTNKKVNFLMDKFRIKPEAVSSEGANISKYLYVFTEAGEYINYGQTGIATLLNTKVKNLKGETKDLYDAYIIQNGKVVWNTKEFGPEQYTDLSEEKYNLATKIQGLNKRIHGNYDPESPIKIKSHVWGRAVMIFRSWLPMAIYTRFGSVNMSKELGRETKGRYITGWEYTKQNKFGVLLPVFKELMTQVINTSTLNRLQLESGAFDELSELDRENMLRNVAELRYILFFMALGTILRGMTIDDEDEEKVALTKFLINQTDRVEGELSFFFSPTDQSRIIRDISPVSRTFKDFYDLVPATTRLITGEDELKSGPNKGDSNFYRQLKQAVPIITQIQKAKELKDLNVDNPMFR